MLHQLFITHCTEQSITQVITQEVIEATKAAIMAVREADNPVDNARPIHTMPRSGMPVLQQPMFDHAVKKQEQKNSAFDRAGAGKRETCINFKYFGNTHEPERCVPYGKWCSSCDKLDHFK